MIPSQQIQGSKISVPASPSPESIGVDNTIEAVNASSGSANDDGVPAQGTKGSNSSDGPGHFDQRDSCDNTDGDETLFELSTSSGSETNPTVFDLSALSSSSRPSSPTLTALPNGFNGSDEVGRHPEDVTKTLCSASFRELQRRRSPTCSKGKGSAMDSEDSRSRDKGHAAPTFVPVGEAIERSLVEQQLATASNDPQQEPSGADKTVASTEEGLDIATAMIPLIPSYVPGSAEIRIRVHGVVPLAGVEFETPPYVRVSLHPGGCNTMVRTPLSRRVSTTRSREVNNSVAHGILGSVSPCAQGSHQYQFGKASQVKDKNTDAEGAPSIDNPQLVVKIGPEIVRGLSERRRPPTLKFDVVCSRCVGECEISLSDTLRRPGRPFRHLQLPLWVSRDQKSGINDRMMPSMPNSKNVGNRTPVGPTESKHTSAVAHLHVDFGVALTGFPAGIEEPVESSGQMRTRGFVKVEAMDVRLIDARGSARKAPDDLRANSLGVSVELTLKGKREIVGFADNMLSYDHQNNAALGPGFEGKGGNGIVIESAYTELDSLVLKLVSRGGCHSRGDIHRCPSVQASRVDERRHETMIPVSDINDLFGGKARWVKMGHYRGSGRIERMEKGNAEREEKAFDGGGYGFEVKLRIVVSDLDPTGGCGGTENPMTGGQPAAEYIGAPQEAAFSSHGSNAEQPGKRCPRDNRVFSTVLHTVSAIPDNWLQATAMVRSVANFESIDNLQNEFRGRQKSLPGPGVVELDVIAICGAVNTLASSADTGNGGMGVEKGLPWRITVEMNGGSKGYLRLESQEGFQDDEWGIEQDVVAVEGARNEAVCWPGGAALRTTYSVHWTPRQSALPFASFAVFHGQVRSICHIAAYQQSFVALKHIRGICLPFES